MSLFNLGRFQLASGQSSNFKIDCDFLRLEDWRAVAAQLAALVGPFGKVEGVPKGGILLAQMMDSLSTCVCGHLKAEVYYAPGYDSSKQRGHQSTGSCWVTGCSCQQFTPIDQLLVVDDVWTTGGSMLKHLNGRTAKGAVLFARGPTPAWVVPLFRMTVEPASVSVGPRADLEVDRVS